jgi:hypothetical protein
MRPYLKNKNNSSQKRAGRVVQGIGPEFKPKYSKKENANTSVNTISQPYLWIYYMQF